MGKLNDVNTTDLPGAIRLGCRTMCNVFNRDDDDIPFFGSQVLPEACLGFSAAHSEAHVPGRHLNALLAAEDVAGVSIDGECVEKHARAAFFSYSGPIPLPLNRDRIGGPLRNFLPHNIREGFHAVAALARYRSSERARDLIDASAEAALDLWGPAKGWDVARIEGDLGLRFRDTGFITGVARAIGPLVKAYRATGSAKALELALLLKEKAVAEFLTEDGAYDRESFGTQAHSVTCVLSSLAQLADLTSDAALFGRVRAFYGNGLQEISDEIGWSIENSSPDADPDRGEANNTGDIVETALILGRWGYPEYYEDAERILRCHLLPSQLRDISFITDPPNESGADGKCDVANRHVGAFGFPAPYGHQPLDAKRVSFNMDIVGGAVASLCEALRESVREDDAGFRVNMLFDRDLPDIKVESPCTHKGPRIRLERPRPLFVRLPSWLDRSATTVDGEPAGRRIVGDHLVLTDPAVGRWIEIGFPLRRRIITLDHRTRGIRVALRGDEPVAMDSFGADLTYFDPIDGDR